MPDFDALIEMFPLPFWAAGALLVLFLIVFLRALRRFGSAGSVAALFGVPALVVIAWSAWNFADQSILRQRVAEREALNARALQLTTAAMAPGSALACLDAGAGDVVKTSCEAALFLKPETVAAATAYVEARLLLLADGLDYSRRIDGAYSGTLAHLRQAIEADRYGFVAHVLATRDGCTADDCGAFSLLRDVNAVKENIKARTLENTIARHAANWGARTPVAAAPPPAPVATISAVPVTRPIDFPTAASIPPVSIMTEPPAPARAAPPPAAGRPQ